MPLLIIVYWFKSFVRFSLFSFCYCYYIFYFLFNSSSNIYFYGKTFYIPVYFQYIFDLKLSLFHMHGLISKSDCTLRSKFFTRFDYQFYSQLHSCWALLYFGVFSLRRVVFLELNLPLLSPLVYCLFHQFCYNYGLYFQLWLPLRSLHNSVKEPSHGTISPVNKTNFF